MAKQNIATATAMTLSVVGLPYYEHNAVKDVLVAGVEFELRREKSNPKDPNAIAVHVTRRQILNTFQILPPSNKNDWKLGFVQARDAQDLAPRIDGGEIFTCTLKQEIGDDNHLTVALLSQVLPTAARAPKRGRDRFAIWL